MALALGRTVAGRTSAPAGQVLPVLTAEPERVQNWNKGIARPSPHACLRVEFEPWSWFCSPEEVLFGVQGTACKQPFGLPASLRLVPVYPSAHALSEAQEPSHFPFQSFPWPPTILSFS